MNELMRLFDDRVERNYASVMAGMTEERRDYISEIPNAVGRRVEIVLLDWIAQHPERTGKYLGLTLSKDDKYVGAGSTHTVVGQADEVVKINRHSVFMSEGQRQDLAEESNEQHRVMKMFLGGLLIDQSSAVEVHLLNTERRAVVSRQPNLEFTDLGLFPAHAPVVRKDVFRQVAVSHPLAIGELYGFAVSAQKLYREANLLVDTSGFQNIVLAKTVGGEALRCIDGLPIANANLGDEERILGQLRELRDLTGQML